MPLSSSGEQNKNLKEDGKSISIIRVSFYRNFFENLRIGKDLQHIYTLPNSGVNVHQLSFTVINFVLIEIFEPETWNFVFVNPSRDGKKRKFPTFDVTQSQRTDNSKQ